MTQRIGRARNVLELLGHIHRRLLQEREGLQLLRCESHGGGWSNRSLLLLKQLLLLLLLLLRQKRCVAVGRRRGQSTGKVWRKTRRRTRG